MYNKLPDTIQTTGTALMIISLVAIFYAVFSASNRKDCEKIFVRGFASSIILWYISWLIR